MDTSLNRETTRKAVIITAVLIVCGLLMYLIIKIQTPTSSAPKVIVQHPKWQQIVEYVTQTGTLVAYNSVDLVARIEGYLDAVEFTDGAFVKKGQELLVVQPEPYMEQLKAAQAVVAIQKAQYAYDKAEYERQKRMYKENATSQNNVEKWQAKTQESEAAIAKAVADEAIASINYGYTHVLAPFDGRIGRHLVDPGNLVGNGVATNLATIEQIDPIYAYFNLSELDLIKLRAAAKVRGFKASEINQVPAYIKLQNETSFKHQGKLDFANTGLNASTGTLEFRAILSNPDYTLLPGLFVQVRVPVSPSKKELTVPDAAVLYDQIGPYLLTIDAKNIVQLVRVELGMVDQGTRVIIKGLNEKDKVIVSGLQFATPGNEVAPQNDMSTKK